MYLKPQRMNYLLLSARIILICLLPALTYAQKIISVRAGLINDIVGEVYLDGQRVQRPADRPHEVTDGIRLRTESGLAEIQLGAGAFLRANQNTLFRMEDSSLESMVICLERGSILIEIIELYKHNNISIRFKGVLIQLEQEGLYRLDTNRSQLRVYGGKALVHHLEREVRAKSENAVALPSLKKSKFDTRINDVFHYWAAHRSFNQNKQFMRINWYSDQWQRLRLRRYRNEYYEVTFHDKENIDSGLPHPLMQMDSIQQMEIIKQEREIERTLERMSNPPD